MYFEDLRDLKPRFWGTTFNLMEKLILLVYGHWALQNIENVDIQMSKSFKLGQKYIGFKGLALYTYAQICACFHAETKNHNCIYVIRKSHPLDYDGYWWWQASIPSPATM